MSLKQQVLFVSSANDSPIKYEHTLVQSLFLHVLETGLQDETVRAKLRPLLEKTTLSDEQLLEKINQIMSAETERYNKMSSGSKKGLRVNQVGTSSAPTPPQRKMRMKDMKRLTSHSLDVGGVVRAIQLVYRGVNTVSNVAKVITLQEV